MLKEKIPTDLAAKTVHESSSSIMAWPSHALPEDPKVQIIRGLLAVFRFLSVLVAPLTSLCLATPYFLLIPTRAQEQPHNDAMPPIRRALP
jgi:hypothetical protein